MRNKWIVAVALGVLTALPAMADDPCLDGDTTCKQWGSGGRSGQAGSGIGIAETEECTGETCVEGGWAGGGGRQQGGGNRTGVEAVTWSHRDGMTIAAFRFADGSTAIFTFEQ